MLPKSKYLNIKQNQFPFPIKPHDTFHIITTYYNTVFIIPKNVHKISMS